jgi:uncharacterized membrane protein YphA (DoxX/SURF4 family)
MWLVLITRLALAIHVIAAALATLVRGLPLPDGAWLPGHAGIRVYAYAAVLLVAAVGLAVQPRRAAIAIAGVLVIVLVEHLAVDPLYNTMDHLVPLLVECGVVIALADRSVPREQTASTLVALARAFLGAIFLAEGIHDLFVIGPVAFARDTYVAPLAGSWMPQPLLWIAGVANPIVQTVGGALFVVGFATRPVAIVLGLFLCQILFGHTLIDPFDSGPDVHSYALANLALVLVVLGLAPLGNRYSVDALLGLSA